jgi:hypothetical protein
MAAAQDAKIASHHAPGILVIITGEVTLQVANAVEGEFLAFPTRVERVCRSLSS